LLEKEYYGDMTPYEHPFSWKALMRIVLLVGGIFLIWKLSTIFADIFIALILASAVYPLILKLQKKFSLKVSVVMVLISFVVPVAFAFIYYIPNIITQIPEIAETIDTILKQLHFVPQALLSFNPYTFITNNITGLSTKAITIFTHCIIVITLVCYYILDYKKLLLLFLELFPKKERPVLTKMLLELKEVNGNYVSGNLLISVILSVVISIVMIVLGIPYAIPLGIFAGVMDLLPIAGSIIGAVPAILIAFSLSPVKGIILLVVHLVYQQLENSVISPMVYKKTLSISAVLSFLSVIIGASLFGIIGAFVALPVAASIPVLIKYKEIFREDGV
jgi:predicted PurR-regulated permease PerM